MQVRCQEGRSETGQAIGWTLRDLEILYRNQKDKAFQTNKDGLSRDKQRNGAMGRCDRRAALTGWNSCELFTPPRQERQESGNACAANIS